MVARDPTRRGELAQIQKRLRAIIKQAKEAEPGLSPVHAVNLHMEELRQCVRRLDKKAALGGPVSEAQSLLSQVLALCDALTLETKVSTPLRQSEGRCLPL